MKNLTGEHCQELFLARLLHSSLQFVILALASAKVLFFSLMWSVFCLEASEPLFAGEVPWLLGFLFQV